MLVCNVRHQFTLKHNENRQLLTLILAVISFCFTNKRHQIRQSGH